MPVTKPTLTSVNPGDPLTAQGWNAVVDGIDGLYDAVIALGGGALDVDVTGPVPGSAVVIAEPLGQGQVSQALPPFGTRTRYLLTGLTDGPWRVHVSSLGYVTQHIDVTMPQLDPLAVQLAADGVVVPDLFGVTAQQALTELATANLVADALVDTTGRDVSRTALPPEYVDSPILFQLPMAGTVLPSGSGRVRLVVASALRRDPVVTMPSLVGLTLAEAQQVLDRLGLVLGDANVYS